MHTPYALPAELNIYQVAQARDALLAWATGPVAANGGTLEVSAAQVEEIDGAGLQLVAALANLQRPWRLVDASAAFTEACRTLGLQHWLPDAAPTAAGGRP